MQDNFDDIPQNAQGHFKLYYYAALLVLLEKVRVSFTSSANAENVFPFLSGYREQFAQYSDEDGTLPSYDRWRVMIGEWEHSIDSDVHLPLRALRKVTGCTYHEMVLWILMGLPESDGRIGLVFETLQGVQGQTRLTVGLLMVWFKETVYGSIRRLSDWGLINMENRTQARPEWVLHISSNLWDVIMGMPALVQKPRLQYVPPTDLPELANLVLPEQVYNRLCATLPMVTDGAIDAVIVRGLQHNGRRDTLTALAKGLGQGALVVDSPPPATDDYWHDIGALATVLNALPIFVCTPPPGESQQLPRLRCYSGGIGVVLGPTGNVSGAGVDRAIMLNLPLPTVNERLKLWKQSVNAHRLEDSEVVATQYRITRGHIQRIARMAGAYARLEERPAVTQTDIQQASQSVNQHTLDLLATYMQPLGTWDDLIVEDSTYVELQMLETRCRHREKLVGALDGALAGSLNAGVRALLRGPTGTGKTMAARILASELNKDLYRVDLASVVNKYIGETEKNLNQVLSRAEELDVILLLDEGDALLTRRTSVQSANDRYANLETNYLLQRLEAYEGILLITTNAADHIDEAFERRMDILVTFKAPAAAQRWYIWTLHLPKSHRVDEALLRDVARRCTLAGGQIRNAVLHATLLALDDNCPLLSVHLAQGVLREYEKAGEICPLPFERVMK